MLRQRLKVGVDLQPHVAIEAPARQHERQAGDQGAKDVHMSALLRPSQPGDQGRELIPRLDLAGQLTLAGRRDHVEPGLAIGSEAPQRDEIQR